MADSAELCPSCGHAPSVTCPACGAQRLRSQRSCPACGRGWVTETGEHEPVLVVAGHRSNPLHFEETLTGMPAVYRELMHDEDGTPLWTQDEEEGPMGLPSPIRTTESPSRSRLATIAAATVIGLVALWGIGQVLTGGSDGELATPTTLPAVFLPPATTTTTLPPSTTTTTIPPTTTLPAIEPGGDPLTPGQLLLSGFGMGDFDFGADFDPLVGRMVATFGQPDQIDGPGVSEGQFGTCPGDTIRTVRFGRLLLIGVDNGGTGVFAGYRMNVNYDPRAIPEIDTLSGLRIGDPVSSLESIYANLDVRYATDDAEGAIFQLWRPADGLLLLWGPVTASGPDGIVQGIYSPLTCTGA